ncbi:anti-anti-sigma factor [Streptomyces sp. V3I8]|uniref:STAS domain-containing protein n=1 Tax=Streptomyces sp. V3I8 TaxID=3042279 RepID=UPI002784AE8B|nr:STAS domain-containing protein [Streptomyces sp. V3I8]MDQ1041615.1 anti-anti-sigma factor [Streptomyces sp. V3I8]
MPEPLELRLLITQHQPAGTVAAVALTGELDASTSSDLGETVSRLAAQPARPLRLCLCLCLCLDLTGVTHCDSASLYTLLGICQALDLTGITVTITAAGPAVLSAVDRHTLEKRLPLQAVLKRTWPSVQEHAGTDPVGDGPDNAHR